MIKDNGKITPKPHAHLLIIQNKCAWLQSDRWKTLGEVAPTRYVFQ